MIRKLALPGGRFILLQHIKFPDRYCEGPEIPSFYRTGDQDYFFSSSPIPSMLHTCNESRRVMMESGWELAFARYNSELGGTVWFNFAKDVLYHPKWWYMKDFGDPDVMSHFYLLIANIKRVALKFDDWRGSEILLRVAGWEELFITLDPAPQIPQWDRYNGFRQFSHPDVARKPWYRRRPFWYINPKMLVTKWRSTAKDQGTSPESMQDNVLQSEKSMQKWRFLDAAGSEPLNCDEFSLEDFFVPSSQGQTLSRDVFERLDSMVERKNEDLQQLQNAPWPINVRVRIGVLVPDGKARALALKRDEFQNNFTELEVVG